MIWWLGTLGTLGTLGLLATNAWIETPSGRAVVWAVAIVGAIVEAIVGAIVVLMLGLWQLIELGRARTGLTAKAHLARIGRSWMGLPLWVKAWLFGLNAVFLAALAFLPSDFARVVPTGYVASGLLLAAFALVQGGLTRLTRLSWGWGICCPGWRCWAGWRPICPPAQRRSTRVS